MIFVVLCLATFGTLSFVTANADYKISGKTVQNVQSYYQTLRKSEEKMQEIDSTILQARSDAKRASAAGSCDGLKNSGDYRKIPAVESALKGSGSVEEKYKVCCAAFSRVLLSRQNGVTLTEEADASLPLNAAFSVAEDQNRTMQVNLTINPLSDTERCKIQSRCMVTAEGAETENSSALGLWQGN